MKEIEQSKYLYSGIEDDTLKHRIKNSLNWYIRKAVVYKRIYYMLSVVSILLPLIVTILHSTDSRHFLESNLQLYSAILAGGTTLITSLLSLFRFKDYWKEYRATAEKIKAELVHFHMGVEPYKEDRTTNLSIALENIISKSKLKEREIIENSTNMYVGTASKNTENK